MELQTENAYNIYDQQMTNDCIIPANCKKEAFTTFVADNIDRNEETLTGYGTTHKVNNLLIQEVNGHFGDRCHTLNPPEEKRRRRSFKPTLKEAKVPRLSSNKRIGPSKKTFDENPEQDLLFAEVEENTYLWSFLRRCCSPVQRFPSWTGFNIVINSGTPVLKSTISYLDCIDAPATEISTIYKVMSRALSLIEALNLEAIVCVFDQAIYSKACEIKWKEPEKFKCCVLVMGIFHLLMVYMGILNKRFGDAGLRDALVQSSIVAEGSMDSALRGKSYNRGVRVYKIFYEALNRLVFSQLNEFLPLDGFVQPISEIDASNKQDIIAVKENAEFMHIYNSYLNLRIQFSSSEFKLQQFWMSYLQMVELLLSTIYSVRLGKWDLLLECIRKIIPYAFVYDHINYARYLPAMLGEMLELEKTFPEIHQQFQAGKFAAQLTNGYPFSRCETDKVIEMTLNKDTKTPGGTTGFSTNVDAVRRWEVNASYRADLRKCFHEHLNYEGQSYKHKDLSPSRIQKDEHDVSSVLTVLTETFIHPLSENNLLSISTGIEVPSSTAEEIIGAEKKGKDLMNSFIKERLEANPTKTVFDTITKTKLGSFSSLRKVTTCKIKNKVVSLKSGNELFARIAIIAQKRSINMKSLFNYPLGSLPLALAEMDGTLKKTAKSVLLGKLEGMGEVVETFPTDYVLIIDGMAAVRQFKVTSLTYRKFAEQLLRSILALGKNASRIDMVFDVYVPNSIKDVERNRRSRGELAINRIIPNSEIKQWNLLLSSNNNKNKLTEFIADEWKNLSHLLGGKTLYVTSGSDVQCITANDTNVVQELRSNHQEADTRMLLHVRHASMSNDTFIVSSPDTDVFLIMLSKVTELNGQLLMLTGTGNKRRLLDLNAVSEGIYQNQNETSCTKEQVMKALLGFHCFTGCDTVSSFAGRGKLKPLKLLFKNSEYIDAFCFLGEDINLDEENTKQLERFTLHMYGKQPTSSISINDLRYNIYCQKVGKSSFDLLPPCLNVFTQHCMRANYQAYIWRQCFNPMIDVSEPTDHGWCMNDGTLDIQWMTCNPAPDEILELVSCSCKRSCNEKCPCFDNDLICTDACQCISCSNVNENENENESDEEENFGDVTSDDSEDDN